MKPAFTPKPGQVDFTNIRWAPVINCVLRHGGKVLLVQRSASLHFYPGYWNGISGFLDDNKSLEEKVKEELMEELHMAPEHIKKIHLGSIFHQEAPEYHKTWIVHPILVDVDTDDVRLDWEGSASSWLTLSEARAKNLLPGLEKVLDTLFPEDVQPSTHA